jgi:hypothetical protein
VRKGLLYVLGAMTAVAIAAVAVLSPWRDRIFADRPDAGPAFVNCGAPGQACCKWSKSLPDFHPQYCKVGAGCDITNNVCVAPCGGSGQACCDGPDTYAPQGNSSPNSSFFCINGDCGARKSMCSSGACTRATRRCDSQCGRTAGGACCPPDAENATATCKAPDLVCEHPRDDATMGRCTLCGLQGQPACPGEVCRASGGVRTMERNGICVACGLVGTPKCPSAPRCEAGSAPDPRGPDCIPGGGENQPCLEGRFCGYDGMYCDNANVCRVCGMPGQTCCPLQPQLGGGTTRECNGFTNLQCANFNGRRVCQYKPGQAPGPGAPPPPPPPSNAKTCGGQNYQFGVTTTHIVWVRQFTGCAAVVASYQANSRPEALQCGRAVFGDAVIEEEVEEYEFAMDGPLGCRTVQVFAKDQEDGNSCAQSQCTNCNEPVPGKCP